MNRTTLLTRPARIQDPAFTTLGQRVTVFGSFGARDMNGTVVKLPRHSGLLHDPFITVEIDGESGGLGPVKPVDPRRVAPVPTCKTCEHGCECDGATGQPDCGHYACWGRADGRTALRCPDAETMRARRIAAEFAHRAVTR